MMTKVVFIFALGLVAYIQSAPRTLETVWLKDLTTRFQTGKRTLSDLDLPNELTFHLSRGSEILTLNLQRNHDINPDADVYCVRKLKDGQSVLVKTRYLEKEDVAYYQDRDNGAFMTVRCVKKSYVQCDRLIEPITQPPVRVPRKYFTQPSIPAIRKNFTQPPVPVPMGRINGNIQIEDSSYDLRPAETDSISRNVFEDAGLLGKRYVLQHQTHIQGQNSAQNKDAAHVNENKFEQEVKAFMRRIQGHQKQNRVIPSDSALSSPNVTALDSRGVRDKSRQLPNVYHIEVAVLIDSGIWDLYSSTEQESNPLTRRRRVKQKIREYFSHIMNGINLRYKTFADRSISISVVPTKYIFFKGESLFTFRDPIVALVNGTKYIDADKYLTDIGVWDTLIGSKHRPDYDHGMLFTGYNLYDGSYNNDSVVGLTFTGKVCVIGERMSVVEYGDYASLVRVAAHELGHSLGANHDGDKDAVGCKAEDYFLMTPKMKEASRNVPYSRYPWIFSPCSIRAFKNTLKDKQCVTNPGHIYDNQEYADFLKNLPGEVYTIDEQCQLLHGPNSVHCQTDLENVCHLLRCTDPKTQICIPKYLGAARGTACGRNRICIEGRCVEK